MITIGRGKPPAGVSSAYNVSVEVDGEAFVVNTRTQAVLPGGMSRKLHERAQRRLAPLEERFLRARGFIVDRTPDEERRALEVEFHQARYRPAIVSLTVTPSYQCNCVCPECPQLDYDRAPVISDQHLDATVRTLEEMLMARKAWNVALWLFGGEPLIATDQCLRVIQGAQEVTRRLGVNLQVMATTNGTLISSPRARAVVENVDLFYVALSESREMHGVQRPYVNGKNGYDDTLAGIALAAQLGKKLIVRLNVTHREGIIDNLGTVLRELHAAMGNTTYGDIKFEFHSFTFQPTCGVSGPKEYAAQSGRALLLPRRGKSEEVRPRSLDMMSVLPELEQVARQSPWPLDKFRLPHAAAIMPPPLSEVGFITMCDYSRGSGVAVAPGGEHYLCAQHNEVPEYKMGHITRPLYNNARYLKIINASPFDDPTCATCAYVPLCYVKKCAHELQDAYRGKDGRVRYSRAPACQRTANSAFAELVRLKQRIAASEDSVDPRFPMKKVTQ
ncbi:MAG TPA: SPASM domain-containing protein [Kofleriaceae bacterium]|nr:SPASM domain-containing protein [Kofleriaceae bacterium]